MRNIALALPAGYADFLAISKGAVVPPAASALRDHTMKLSRRKFLHVTAAGPALVTASRIARAQAYPSRPITMIVPFPPGGLTDVLGRVLASGMQMVLGQSVVIENVGGADGSIGTGRVARAVPDGYTVVLGIWNTHVANGVTYKLDYDVVKDFAPIALCADAPLVLLAKKSVLAHDLRGYIEWLKANPDKASMATVGIGSPVQVLGLLLQKESRRAICHGTLSRCRTRSAGRRRRADRHDVRQHGNCTALRASPRILLLIMGGAVCPSRDAKGYHRKLNTAAVKTLHDPTVAPKLEAQGFKIPSRDRQTPEALGTYQKAEIEKWWPIIRAAGIKVQ